MGSDVINFMLYRWVAKLTFGIYLSCALQWGSQAHEQRCRQALEGCFAGSQAEDLTGHRMEFQDLPQLILLEPLSTHFVVHRSAVRALVALPAFVQLLPGCSAHLPCRQLQPSAVL